MATMLKIEQVEHLLYALSDVSKDGKTERKCPICGGELIVTPLGNSGEVSCSTPGCIEKEVFRGI